MANVLIVDDAAFMRMLLKDILEGSGHNVIGEAGNGQQAVDFYKTHHPDIVTLDITMPEMDGLQCLKSIMSYDNNAKIIMCSAMGQQAMVIDAIQGGAIDFIIKPFKKDRVIDAINKAVV